jgi:hypothetical protein
VPLRKPGTWFDVQAQLRAIDDDLALVRIIDKLERVCIAWLLLSTVDSDKQTLSHAWSCAEPVQRAFARISFARPSSLDNGSMRISSKI